LGDVISAQGITVYPANIETVVKWERSQTVIEVRSLLGLAGYYRRFVEGFSKRVSLVTQLTKRISLSLGQMNVKLASRT